MIRILGILLVLVFAAISLLHLYWAAGGSFGKAVAIPSVGGTRSFNPSPLATVLVAVAFLVAIFVIIGRLGLLGDALPRWIFRWATLGIALIFLLRAIGEFKLVGFFKRVSNSPFAYWDTLLFSPLCLLIAIIAFALFYNEA
ncbi:MAG: DUF3995 domain-containing protein [Rubrivivax sp.]|nr:DUF3995 domain-containing protein [Pyrinomonadaceae bacterium]